MEGSAAAWVEADLIISGASEVLTCARDGRDARGRISAGGIPEGRWPPGTGASSGWARKRR